MGSCSLSDHAGRLIEVLGERFLRAHGLPDGEYMLSGQAVSEHQGYLVHVATIVHKATGVKHELIVRELLDLECYGDAAAMAAIGGIDEKEAHRLIDAHDL